MWRRSAHLVLLMAILLAASANGASSLSLERWLERTAAPDLARSLSLHPKFAGEVIRLSAMQSGQLVAPRDRLTARIEQQLMLQLNRFDAVRIRWSGQPAKPSDRPVHYVLGIEVSRNGPTQHQVTLAMVDLGEGIWVSGTAMQWRGRLTGAEKKLLAQITQPGQPSIALLSPITYERSPREGVCAKERGRCALAAVTLQQPGNLWVFSSHRGELPTHCKVPSARDAGTYHFRLLVPHSGGPNSDAGLYAVATQDQALAHQLTTLAERCGSPNWQAELSDVLEGSSARYEWQALHLKHQRGALRRL